MPTLKNIVNRYRRETQTLRTIKMRAHLNADTLFALIRKDLQRVPDHRAANASIPLDDALMSAFAMFSLKDPSLLAFDDRRFERPESLHGVYGVGVIPSDTQMRTILDEVVPTHLRRPFRSVFHQLQRGKVLPKMTCLGGHLLLAIDGTGIHSSENIGADYCLTKERRNGTIEYHLQMVTGAFVSQGCKEVLPLCPELIRRQDGSIKNDCERNTTRRFIADFRREHPHLKVIVTEDGLSANAPHIKDLVAHGLRYILSAKPGDHAYLFSQADEAAERGEVTELILPDGTKANKTHCFRFINSVPLNKTSQDELRVNFLEHWEVETRCEEVFVLNRFSWVTDLAITPDNAMEIMRCGRARWRIENETFNTLKNQGYNLGHNYGLGKKQLSAVFMHLMLLAFLVDQVQQLCCPLFQAARAKVSSKRALWERMRNYFRTFIAPSMERILRMIAHGFEGLQCPTYD
jgi:hypothetical protein